MVSKQWRHILLLIISCLNTYRRILSRIMIFYFKLSKCSLPCNEREQVFKPCDIACKKMILERKSISFWRNSHHIFSAVIIFLSLFISYILELFDIHGHRENPRTMFVTYFGCKFKSWWASEGFIKGNGVIYMCYIYIHIWYELAMEMKKKIRGTHALQEI